MMTDKLVVPNKMQTVAMFGVIFKKRIPSHGLGREAIIGADISNAGSRLSANMALCGGTSAMAMVPAVAMVSRGLGNINGFDSSTSTTSSPKHWTGVLTLVMSRRAGCPVGAKCEWLSSPLFPSMSITGFAQM
jgi:hypothetical protein